MPQALSTSRPSANTSTLRCRRLLAVLLAALLSALVAATGPSVPAAADGIGMPDLLAVSGYDFETDAAADVVADSAGNNLVLRVDAGSPLTDGTIVLTLPRPAWRSALQVGDRLYPGDPRIDGSVVVRPSEELDELGPDDCRGTAGPPTVTVLNTAKAHVAVVTHLSCEAGQSVTLRVFGVRAPEAVGRYVLPVSVSDAGGQRGPSRLTLRVVPRPSTSLRVDVPATVRVSTPEPVLLRALRRDGRIDTTYRGTVALRAVDGRGQEDCTFSPDATTTFTAAEAGVKTLTFSVQTPQSHWIEVRDVGHRANGARSGRYDVVGTPANLTCSVSYH